MFKIGPKTVAFKIIRSLSYYVTTPVFYVNSSPHIGHVHTLLLADALNLHHKLKCDNNDTLLTTGVDEHGIKIQTSAELSQVSCEEFCNQNTQKFLNLFNKYETTVSDFVRTSEERHKKAVTSVWNKLNSDGYIYKNKYSGWYCISDETFVPETSVTQKEVNGKIVHLDPNGNLVKWSEEENYMFKFSEFEGEVLDWLVTKKPVIPEKFNSETISMLKRAPIGDISISRPVERLKWGIQVPNDASQTIYVWLDALTSYLTAVEYPNELKRWPIDCQVIGKDIVKFHAIYWPAFLIALSLPLPKRIICHSHWLVDSFKMSKSRGNVVDPAKENQLLTIEGLRYYLLRNSTPHSDTDYSRVQALRRVNSELADTYGNLMSRCCAPAINPTQSIPTKLTGLVASQILDIQDRLDRAAEICNHNYSQADFYKGIDEIMSILRLNNALFEETKPWKLVREMDTNEESIKRYSNLLTITFETLRICSILLQPIVPKLSKLALNRMNVENRSWKDACLSIGIGDPSTCQRFINQDQDSVLFRRLKVIDS